MDISDNTFYYSLSTISQTMAALFAVLGTFIVFKIQSTEARLINILSERAQNETQNDARSERVSLIVARKFEEAFAAFSMSHSSNSIVQSDIASLQNCKSLLKLQFVFSVVIISVSVVMLGFFDHIKNEYWFQFMFFSVIATFVSSLVFFARKMYSVL